MLDVTTSLTLCLIALVIGVLVGPLLEELLFPEPAEPTKVDGTLTRAGLRSLRCVPVAPDNGYPANTPAWLLFNHGFECGMQASYSLGDQDLIRAFTLHSMKNAQGIEDDPFECGWVHAARPEYHRIIRRRVVHQGLRIAGGREA